MTETIGIILRLATTAYFIWASICGGKAKFSEAVYRMAVAIYLLILSTAVSGS